MFGIELVIAEITGLTAPDLERWINNDWVRPQGPAGAYLFQDIDVARVRLICELRFDLRIDEETLPVVLMLLDQIYGLRRELRQQRSGALPPAPARECPPAASRDTAPGPSRS